MYGIIYRNENDFKKKYYCKCFNFIERHVLFEHYGFKKTWGKMAYDSIISNLSTTRADDTLYVKIKNL